MIRHLRRRPPQMTNQCLLLLDHVHMQFRNLALSPTRVYYQNDGCEKCTLLPLLYRPVCPSDSLRLANQEQVRGSCVSFESLGAVGSTRCRCVFLLRACELLDQAVRGSCVSFESLVGIGPGQCHGPGPMTPASQSGISTRIVCFFRDLRSRWINPLQMCVSFESLRAVGSSSTRIVCFYLFLIIIGHSELQYYLFLIMIHEDSLVSWI